MKYETAISISEFVKSFPQRKLVREFDYLCQITETKEHEKNFCQNENIQHLNRYIDILPYKHTIVSCNINEKFYINANYIRGIDNVEKKYIATQGPIQQSVNDFWHMIWTNEVGVIIMLCKLVDHNFSQCEKYWPEISDNYGPYQVKLQKKEELKGGLMLNELIIKFQEQEKLIHHYQWNGWPDFGVVDKDSFFLIDLLANIANQSILENKKTVIHCSAGIGRTGTLLSICYIKQLLNQKEEKISIFSIVRRLREQRAYMVQTEEQYEMVYRFTLWLIQNLKYN
ncbi:unnamed protein product (macronuclear) [Paramecium tetraurelia]|uniref:Protein tyrosine phosphatase n=1 Tax=Paramecium tetraurelia TaxID=5888 RepID=A0C8B3_PARTE|nr:uncharacterized protein GSPATT00036162001 [Paramecium tetraurelia]CAK67030.1 unnamed protein product [Paramecium tetraurelia]|eukprot:XP_001434427.1 hypothetical protein (macronuclear) [Paramecium tetraurelia strain d4-2]